MPAQNSTIFYTVLPFVLSIFLKCFSLQISFWLAKLSGEHKIPEYEINKQTLGILHEFMKVNKELDRMSTISIDDVTKKTQEYAAESNLCFYYLLFPTWLRLF